MANLTQPSQWNGIWTALITPLDERGQIDSAALEALIQEQVSMGVAGLVVAGSTGEGSLLNKEEYTKLLGLCRQAAPTTTLVAGLGIGGTASALELAEIAKQEKMDGLLAAPPAYIKAPPQGLKLHFEAIAKVGLPICLYEVPSRAASSIPVDLVIELAGGSDAFVAIKDATADLDRYRTLAKGLQGKMALLTGDDESFVDFLECGGQGIVSVTSHFVGDKMKDVLENFNRGKKEQAQSEFKKLLPLCEALFWVSNPIPVKSLWSKLNQKGAFFKAPLLKMEEEKLEKLCEIYKKAKEN